MTTPKPGYKTLTNAQLICALLVRDQELADAYKLIKLMDEQLADKKQIRVFFHGNGVAKKS